MRAACWRLVRAARRAVQHTSPSSTRGVPCLLIEESGRWHRAQGGRADPSFSPRYCDVDPRSYVRAFDSSQLRGPAVAVCLRHVLCPPIGYAAHRLGANRCSRRAAFTDKSGYHPCEQGRPRDLSPTGQCLRLRIGDANEGTGAAPYQRGYEDARPRPQRGGTRSRGPVARDPLEPMARGNAAQSQYRGAEKGGAPSRCR